MHACQPKSSGCYNRLASEPRPSQLHAGELCYSTIYVVLVVSEY